MEHIEDASSLDLLYDSYDHIIEKIENRYDKESKTPTGFLILDDYVFFGGFARSRLYAILGAAGCGKSTLINNLILKSALSPRNKNKEGKNVYLYVTFENTVEESFLRTYCSCFSKTTPQVLSEIREKVNIEERLKEKLEKNNSTIVMKYYPPKTVSPTELVSLINDVLAKYGEGSIRGLYVDYLDIMKTTDIKTDLYRLQLGDITLSLKNIATSCNIPVIAVSHLNKEGYKTKSAFDLNLVQVGESLQKVERADCIILMAQDPYDKHIVNCKIGKNRDGKVNVPIQFRTDFEKYQFISGTLARKDKEDKNEERKDQETSTLNVFKKIEGENKELFL